MFFRNSIAGAALFASLIVTGEAMGCASYNAAQISQAIQNSPNANSTLKNASCQFGGAGVAEIKRQQLFLQRQQFWCFAADQHQSPGQCDIQSISRDAIATTGQHLGATGWEF